MVVKIFQQPTLAFPACVALHKVRLPDICNIIKDYN